MACTQCKYWKGLQEPVGNEIERSEDRQIRMIGAGRCGYARQFWNSVEWDESGEKIVLIDSRQEQKVFVKDVSDYHAELITMPDHSCSAFEK